MIPLLARILEKPTSPFRPPFRGLGWVVIAYVLFAFLVYPHSALLRLEFPDTDDYMYLDQVLDWLNGQGWYDNIQHRLDPPQGPMMGTPIHFSRLAMLPMAALTKLFQLTGLGVRGASSLMAVIYPLMLLGGLFAALRWTAKSYLPRDWAGVTPLIALFMPVVVAMFRPGHIDHHGLILVILTLVIGCTLRTTEQPESLRWPVMAGLLLALGQTLALEILPWLLVIAGWIGLYAIIEGRVAARQGLIFGLTLYLGSFVGLWLTRPPGDIMTADVLTYSVVYVVLTGAMAVTFAAVAVAASTPVIVRLLVGGITAAVTGYLFLHHFPELVSGPYGGIDPALAQIILGEIVEALPYHTAHNGWLDVSVVMLTPCVALAITACFTIRQSANNKDFWRWGLIFLLLAIGISLTVFYQRRFVAMTGLLGAIPFAVLLHQGLTHTNATLRGRKQVYAEIALLLICGPLTGLLYPAFLDGRSFNPGMLLFAAGNAGTDKCEMYELENALRNPRGLGDRPRLIMNTLSSGPELLYRTEHRVLAGPYHMDVEGNVDSTRFFSTPYPDEARDIVRRDHVDLVVACRAFPEVYLRPMLNKELVKGESTKDFAPHMIERLMVGKVPTWLKPVPVEGLVNYVIYEVVAP